MSDAVASFVAELRSLLKKERRDGPATLSHLRRGLADPSYALGRVGWLFRRFSDERDLDTAIVVGGLFAWARGNCEQDGNRSVGQAYAATTSHSERRMIDLLDSDAAELPYKLRQVISILANHRSRLDWIQLFKNINHWSDEDRSVQKDWARGYWLSARSNAEFEVEPETPPTES